MEKSHKLQFVRIIKPGNEKAFIDKDNSGEGRGAYICPDTKCVDMALKKKKLSRALRCEIDSSFYDELKEYIKSIGE